MDDLIEFRSSGLKCDNESCDWEDTTIPIEAFKYFVNACCPKCNEVILTPEDFQSVIQASTIVKMFNSMTEDQLKAFGITPDPEAKKSTLNLQFKDGTVYKV
jgi:hypothetical protein